MRPPPARLLPSTRPSRHCRQPTTGAQGLPAVRSAGKRRLVRRRAAQLGQKIDRACSPRRRRRRKALSVVCVGPASDVMRAPGPTRARRRPTTQLAPSSLTGRKLRDGGWASTRLSGVTAGYLHDLPSPPTGLPRVCPQAASARLAWPTQTARVKCASLPTPAVFGEGGRARDDRRVPD